ncbi:MAG TPA: hypothetical protein VJV03_09600 [Pyrinomonadaceae bacterium]|nr:hypothetical protein [Pyrinomonadaceae bacterium]
MKRSKSSKRFLIASLILCTASVITVQGQVVPQEGAINTTRSNIKNTSRTGPQGQLNGLRVEVARYGGAQFAAGTRAGWKVYEVNKMGDFNLGILAAGHYELRITRGADADGDTAPDASRKQTADGGTAPSNITVTLDGVKGGSIKKDLAVTPSDAGAETARTTLGSKIDTAEADLSGKLSGPGRPVFGNIRFETDGNSETKGAVRTTR